MSESIWLILISIALLCNANQNCIAMGFMDWFWNQVKKNYVDYELWILILNL